MHGGDVAFVKRCTAFHCGVDGGALLVAASADNVVLAADRYGCSFIQSCHLCDDVNTLLFHSIRSADVFGAHDGVKLCFVAAVARQFIGHALMQKHRCVFTDHTRLYHVSGDFSDKIHGVLVYGCMHLCAVVGASAEGGPFVVRGQSDGDSARL